MINTIMINFDELVVSVDEAKLSKYQQGQMKKKQARRFSPKQATPKGVQPAPNSTTPSLSSATTTTTVSPSATTTTTTGGGRPAHLPVDRMLNHITLVKRNLDAVLEVYNETNKCLDRSKLVRSLETDKSGGVAVLRSSVSQTKSLKEIIKASHEIAQKTNANSQIFRQYPNYIAVFDVIVQTFKLAAQGPGNNVKTKLNELDNVMSDSVPDTNDFEDICTSTVNDLRELVANKLKIDDYSPSDTSVYALWFRFQNAKKKDKTAGVYQGLNRSVKSFQPGVSDITSL